MPSENHMEENEPPHTWTLGPSIHDSGPHAGDKGAPVLALLQPHVGDTYLAEPPEHLSKVGGPQECLVSIIAELKWVALRSGTF